MTRTVDLGISPIGTIRCDAIAVEDVPSEGLPSRVELLPEYVAALEGIEVGDHVYVIAIFDRADPKQLHGSPGTSFQQGAFSIRSSSRPNRIGMTLAEVTAIDGGTVSFEWLDFADGSPVIDLKRYNWRWEGVLSARRLDRTPIERQIPREALIEVLARPAYNLHGERCAWVDRAAVLAAQLVQVDGLWTSSPELRWHVAGSGHLVDAVQAISGGTVGNDRLRFDLDESVTVVTIRSTQVERSFTWNGHGWSETPTASIG